MPGLHKMNFHIKNQRKLSFNNIKLQKNFYFIWIFRQYLVATYCFLEDLDEREICSQYYELK